MAGAYLPIDCEPLDCDLQERTFSSAVRVKIPTVPTNIDKGFKECCYTNYVFADLTSSDIYKNDFKGVFHQKQTSSETCTFILRELSSNTDHVLNSSTYGVFKNFGTIPENLNLGIFKLEWRKVLQLHGEGAYTIIKRITVVGISVDIPSNTYELRKYSIRRANGTVRVDTKHNGRMVGIGVDFKGSNFETSLRTRGFFGNRDSNYIQDNHIYSNNEKTEQVSILEEKKYQFQMIRVPECITDDFFSFTMLANEIIVSDYNINNHSYEMIRIPVVFSDNGGTKYTPQTRNAIINITFEYRYKNSKNINY